MFFARNNRSRRAVHPPCAHRFVTRRGCPLERELVCGRAHPGPGSRGCLAARGSAGRGGGGCAGAGCAEAAACSASWRHSKYTLPGLKSTPCVLDVAGLGMASRQATGKSMTRHAGGRSEGRWFPIPHFPAEEEKIDERAYIRYESREWYWWPGRAHARAR